MILFIIFSLPEDIILVQHQRKGDHYHHYYRLYQTQKIPFTNLKEYIFQIVDDIIV